MAHEKEALSAYSDGELKDPARRQELERHLAACPDCRAELEELRAISKMMGSLPRAELPAGFRQRLENRRRAQAEPARTTFLPVPMRALAFAASSLIVMVVAYEGLREKPAMVPSTALLSGSASGLAAPADQKAALSMGADGNSAGAPLGEKAAEAPRFDNTALNRELEDQKAKLGVRILPRSLRAVRGSSGGGAGSADEEEQPAETQRLQAPPAPAPVEGDTVGLLAAVEEAAPMRRYAAKAEMSVPAPRAFSGAAGKNAPPGAVARSASELKALWALMRPEIPAPKDTDFSKDMVVVLLAQGELLAVSEQGDRLVARFRLGPGAPESKRFLVVPQSPLPVVFSPSR